MPFIIKFILSKPEGLLPNPTSLTSHNHDCPTLLYLGKNAEKRE